MKKSVKIQVLCVLAIISDVLYKIPTKMKDHFSNTTNFSWREVPKELKHSDTLQ